MSTKNTFTMAHRVALADLLRSHYTASNSTDADFATFAAGQIGVHVSASQVAYMRDSLGIRNNVMVQREADAERARQAELLPEEVDLLRKKVNALEAQVSELASLAHKLAESVNGFAHVQTNLVKAVAQLGAAV